MFAAYDKPKVEYASTQQILPTQKPRDWYTALRQDYETVLGDIPRLRNLVPELFGGWSVDISLLD